MEMTAAASWLMDAFSGFDLGILSLMHTLAEHAGVVLTPLCKLITLLGEKGVLFFALALVLMCFARTRPLGVCIFGAVCCGALITNIVLKDLVARPRPFETLSVYREWWQAIGSPAEDGFSFPSGHVTAAAAGTSSIFFMRGKRWLLPGACVVLLMYAMESKLVIHSTYRILLYQLHIAYTQEYLPEKSRSLPNSTAQQRRAQKEKKCVFS